MYPGAIGAGNDLCIFRIAHRPPPHVHSIPPDYPAAFAIAPSTRHQTSARSGDGPGFEPFRICLGTFGNPLGGLDMHQIEVGFLYLPCVGG